MTKLLEFVGAVVLANIAADVASLPIGRWIAVVLLLAAAFFLLVCAFDRQPRAEKAGK
jgi:hypothetical protein